MKQFKFLAMAIFAMIMSIGFVACSSDDDDNNGGGSITSGKKLVRISSEYETINFTYGEDGKIQLVTHYSLENCRDVDAECCTLIVDGLV
jgi:uncharacterized lipoprotein YehR (DUF1307 family)